MKLFSLMLPHYQNLRLAKIIRQSSESFFIFLLDETSKNKVLYLKSIFGTQYEIGLIEPDEYPDDMSTFHLIDDHFFNRTDYAATLIIEAPLLARIIRGITRIGNTIKMIFSCDDADIENPFCTFASSNQNDISIRCYYKPEKKDAFTLKTSATEPIEIEHKGNLLENLIPVLSAADSLHICIDKNKAYTIFNIQYSAYKLQYILPCHKIIAD